MLLETRSPHTTHDDTLRLALHFSWSSLECERSTTTTAERPRNPVVFLILAAW